MILLAPILSFLRAVPWWAYAIAACLAWGGWQRHRATSAAKIYQSAQIEAAKRTEQALIANVQETARRLAAQQKATDNAIAQTIVAQTDAAATATSADRLRKQLIALRAARAPAGDPAAAGASPADRIPEILAACVDRYRDVAAAADRAVIAGKTCEAAYYGLSSK